MSPLKLQAAVAFVLLYEYLVELMGEFDAIRDQRIQVARREYTRW